MELNGWIRYVLVEFSAVLSNAESHLESGLIKENRSQEHPANLNIATGVETGREMERLLGCGTRVY